MELRLSSVFSTLSAGFCKPLQAIGSCLFWNIFVQGHDDDGDDDDDDDDGDDDKDHDDGEEED